MEKQYQQNKSEIVTKNGLHPVAIFIEEEIATDFLNAYNEKQSKATKTAEQRRAEDILQCFSEFNEILEGGGTITKDSIVHYGLKHLLK